jgi:hypothetical protein
VERKRKDERGRKANGTEGGDSTTSDARLQGEAAAPPLPVRERERA